MQCQAHRLRNLDAAKLILEIHQTILKKLFGGNKGRRKEALEFET